MKEGIKQLKMHCIKKIILWPELLQPPLLIIFFGITPWPKVLYSFYIEAWFPSQFSPRAKFCQACQAKGQNFQNTHTSTITEN